MAEQQHNIEPVFDENSRILILGSFPSVKSREQKFFYGHPQNRFWKVLAAVFGCPVPVTVEEKKAFLLENRVALWDVIASCDIENSADTSITDVKVNDIGIILNRAKIERIFVNGKAAEKYYNALILPSTGIPAQYLPSTSPANAAMKINRLTDVWKAAITGQ